MGLLYLYDVFKSKDMSRSSWFNSKNFNQHSFDKSIILFIDIDG
jgi:hypothetical protein